MIKISLLHIFLICNLVANITGTVYKELPVNGSINGNSTSITKNIYGVKESNEPGIAGLTVKAYDINGNLIDTTTTDINGNYILNTSNGKYRVEFSNWPSFLKPAPIGDSSHTSVQFVNDGSVNVDFGLLNPADYIDSANPKVVTTIAVSGSGNGEVNDTDPDKSSANFATIVDWNYNATTDDSDEHKDAIMYETGSIWGIAYSRQRDKLFSSAVVRRHTGFGKSGNTIGSIYVTTGIRDGNPQTTKFIDLSSLGIDVGSVIRSINPSDKEYYISDCVAPTCRPDYSVKGASYDIDAYKNVGTVGIGDIDLSEDEKTLYAMNLKNREVVAIDVDSKILKAIYPIHNPGCSNGDYRPWAISTHNNSLFVGVVCSAETSQNRDDLKAYVLKFNGAGFDTVLNFDLNFTREPAIYGQRATWHPWERGITWHDDVYAQPILGDIEFDETGAMILGFIDRYGFMTGNNNYTTNTSSLQTSEGHSGGDILRACPNSNGTWDIEHNGSCGGIITDGSQKSDAGPGGGEYYLGDNAGESSNGLAWNHRENSSGGLTVLVGSKEVMSGVFDPINADAGGVARFNYIDGKSAYRKKELYGTQNESGPGPHFGKAGGIGDIELISTAAPIEVGNRVWFDEDGDGIQDANESGISGVRIKLICNNQELATAITDTNGEFLFSNDPLKRNTQSYIYNITQLKANRGDCKIVIPDYKNQIPLKGYIVTIKDANNNQNDNIDSDGDEKLNSVEAAIKASNIPYAGSNNHTFDFGFSKPKKACLGDRVWYDDNYNGIEDNGEDGVANVTVKLLDKSGNKLNITTTDSNGYYKFCNLDEGKYSVEFVKDSLPQHAIFTKQNQGSDDKKDSDADPQTGKTNIIYLRGGDNYKDLDAGLFIPACIGDRIWFDKNKNGIQDVNESGIRSLYSSI